MFLTSFTPHNLFIYTLGILVEFLGFAVLFNKKWLNPGFVTKNHLWIGMILIIIGWLISAPIGRI